MASLHKLDDLLAGLGISHMPNAYMPEVLRRCPRLLGAWAIYTPGRGRVKDNAAGVARPGRTP